MKKILIVFICLLLLCGCGNKEDEKKEVAKVKRVACKDVNSIENAVIIDVREADEYAEGHLDNAINISNNVIKFTIQGKVSDLETPIIVYCRSGNRSAQSAKTLVNLGYKNVYDMGGITSCEGEE